MIDTLVLCSLSILFKRFCDLSLLVTIYISKRDRRKPSGETSMGHQTKDTNNEKKPIELN